MLLMACWRSRCPTAWLLSAASIWLVVLGSPGSIEAEAEQTLLAHLPACLRYYYAAEVFFFLAVLVMLDPSISLPKELRVIGASWLYVALLVSCGNYVQAPRNFPMFFYGPDWAQQVQQWRGEPSNPLALWPNGWQLNLSPKP